MTSRTATFQAKFFLAALGSAVIALAVAGALFAAAMRSEINEEIGATLVAQANRGLAAARNAGLQAASGEFAVKELATGKQEKVPMAAMAEYLSR